MELLITNIGELRCVYSETLPLTAFGTLTIARASHVEPTTNGMWTADLSPVDGPTLGPFKTRSEALTAEDHWLSLHWLTTNRTTV
jgi:hypothetical protein